MAEVTVSELAKSVGASEERLLTQMKEAGLNHKSSGEVVSDEEKQILLNYLKNLHGESAREPKKITLKRKKVSKINTGGSGPVVVEVRKKRSYVKRSVVQAEQEAEQARIEAEKQAALKQTEEWCAI